MKICQDRLKLDLHLDNLNTNKQKKQQRDQIIAAEIYKMFRTIRDHQSANVKSRGEIMNASAPNAQYAAARMLRKSGSWSYSSEKRHVIAKVMELPFAEDVGQLVSRFGLMYTGSAEAQQQQQQQHLSNPMLALAPLDTTNERVFIRIDDYLSKQVEFFCILLSK